SLARRLHDLRRQLRELLEPRVALALQALERLRRDADRIVVLATPEPFLAVGEWYRRFDQTSDDEVIATLAIARRNA
ncbi:MAG: phosphoribosyltransferase, partial [Actinomycetota bacterium]